MAAPGDLEADAVVEILAELGATSARVIRRALRDGRVRHRVVVKSGEQIGVVLAGLGAHRAFLERDLRRLERGLRSEANRAANADRANLDRAATAAARQVAAINAALDRLEPDSLPDDIRQTALARIANPGATLGQVGALLDPPVGRSAVHRRIRRLLATGATDAAEPASTAD
jgi:DNA-binding protein WhiA